MVQTKANIKRFKLNWIFIILKANKMQFIKAIIV